MANHTCPDGHTSDTADFCSQCGIEMSPSPAGTPASSPATSAPATKTGGTGEKCPKCSTDRDDPTSVFCGVCGYNFDTKTGGGQVAPDHDVVPNTPVTSGGATGAASTPTVTPANGARVDIEVSYTDDARASDAPLKFNLFDEESLIGRKKANFKQTVAIEDAAVSTRHLMIVRRADGTAVVRDLDSTNGSKLNGKDLKGGAEEVLKEGDEITIGEFTKIKVVAIRQS